MTLTIDSGRKSVALRAITIKHFFAFRWKSEPVPMSCKYLDIIFSPIQGKSI